MPDTPLNQTQLIRHLPADALAPPAPQPVDGLEAINRATALREQAESTTVATLMSRGVVCLTAEAPLAQVAQLLLERDIGSAPVVDAAWRPVGMVSKTDLLRAYAQGARQRAVAQPSDALADAQARMAPQTVADMLQPLTLSLHEASPVSVAAALMAYEAVHRLPIVAASGELVGVISTLDIVRWVARCTYPDDVPETSDAA
jgi:CBS domain-containing protein